MTESLLQRDLGHKVGGILDKVPVHHRAQLHALIHTHTLLTIYRCQLAYQICLWTREETRGSRERERESMQSLYMQKRDQTPTLAVQVKHANH